MRTTGKIVVVIHFILICTCFALLLTNLSDVLSGGIIAISWCGFFLSMLVALAISNIQLLRGRAVLLNLRINFLANLLQILSISIFGFRYIIMLGFALTPYMSLTEHTTLGVRYSALLPQIEISFSKGDAADPYIGVNLVAFFFASFFINHLEKMKKKEAEELVSSIGKN